MKPAEEYILNQPEPFRSILLHVQAVIELSIPDLKLLYKFKIPFYYYNNKPFIYLNASHKQHFVDVAFMKGYELTLHQDQLTGDGRTLVKSLRYNRLEEIDNTVLTELIFEQLTLFTTQ